MLPLGRQLVRDCQGLHRREFLCVGAAGFLGLTLPDLFGADEFSDGRRASSCILIYLAGGPSHLETFDPKPKAPLRIRGPWGAIPTSVPGTMFGEMLPQLAQSATKFTLLRALHHTNALHNPAPMLTGNPQHRVTLPSALSYLLPPGTSVLPGFVNLGPKLSIVAGELGAGSEPLEIADPLRSEQALKQFRLPPEVDGERLNDRKTLLQQIDAMRRTIDANAAVRLREGNQAKAWSLLTSADVRNAFDLSQEPESRRDRFGANAFGQSCLLARRLIEAGTRVVQINWANREDGFAVGWDVHGDDQAGLVRMEQHLCPRFDQGMSALIEDLSERGLLESTLVIAMGEFGRSPQINGLGGRDHWPSCFSALIGGGGVPAGRVVGRSDRDGGYPSDRPVSPADFAATVFRLMGVDPHTDDRIRPAVFDGHAIGELLR